MSNTRIWNNPYALMGILMFFWGSFSAKYGLRLYSNPEEKRVYRRSYEYAGLVTRISLAVRESVSEGCVVSLTE